MMDNMVDDNDNSVVDQVPSWELALLLLGGFRTLVDQAHASLAERGHPDVRPAHGFTLQAVGSGATASEVGARLGVSKQAATKTLTLLEQQGYVARSLDPTDARRRTVVVTPHGRDLLAASARAFDEVVDSWRDQLGEPAVRSLGHTLKALDLPAATRLDLGAWSG